MIEARGYQIKAVENSRNHNYRGLLEMATGTGKTITSLLIANDYFDYNGKIFMVVLVPFVHLMEQWEQSIMLFDFKDILLVSSGYKVNERKITKLFRDYNRNLTNKAALVISYDSFLDVKLQSELKKINNLFLVADECHNFGRKEYQRFDFTYIKYRLGLSATPVRKYDEEGTEYITNYFQNSIYEFSLEEAIKQKFLTPYIYEPIEVELTSKEKEAYLDLSEKIRKLRFAIEEGHVDEEDLKNLLIKRSNIVKRAENKLVALIQHLSVRDINDLHHILIYCAPGTITNVTQEVSKLGVRLHSFDHTNSQKERVKILDSFDSEHLQILTAMHCLDEGVDVPATKEAYFLASTTNEREYVQRRGRVLRNSKNKTEAKIYDFVILPAITDDPLLQGLQINEKNRMYEFARSSLNKEEIFIKYSLDENRNDR